MTFVSDLEPKALWSHFDHILTIPRASKDEVQAREYVIEVAERTGLEHQTDSTGNVVVKKPGSGKGEDAPAVILQSHLDMVQEKNSDVDFDFASDAIQPQQDGDWVTATGTTLGSDNGMGVAAMLAVAEADDLEHPPLELLFTVDEETGLTGAAQLDASMLSARRLVNLDSEDENKLCVGCAGGADSHLSLPIVRQPVGDDTAALRVHLGGLHGGHSGIDIHLQRGNAVQLLARILTAGRDAGSPRIAELSGGNAHNAIPREARATLVVDAREADGVNSAMATEYDRILEEFKSAEPEMKVSIEAVDAPADAWDDDSTDRALGLLLALPHGVVTMSYDIPDLVETSNNLATVHQDDGQLEIETSSRSSVASALDALRRRIRAIGELAGASVEEDEGYPGWQPDMDSEMLAIVKQVHIDELEVDPEVYAVHAGLECGLIGEMLPGMDMISIGPQIEHPHSPNERVLIPSVERFWRLLTGSLARLAQG